MPSHTRKFLFRKTNPENNPAVSTIGPRAPNLFPVDNVDQYPQLTVFFIFMHRDIEMAYTRRFLSRVSDPAHNPTARPQAPTLFPIDSIDEYLQLVKIFSSSLLLTFAMTFLVAIMTVVGFGRF
ncbi:hypothetical protein ACHAPX_008110, partial [Trichoderma viride]